MRTQNSRRVALAALALAAVAVAPLAPVDAVADTPPVSSTVAAPGAGPGASITVSRTRDLVNQSVIVRWTGFRPSSAPQLDNGGDSYDVNTLHPVRVYQCRGDGTTLPASSSDCYGSPGFRGAPASDGLPAVGPVAAFTYPGQVDEFDANPDGPSNWQDTTTAADGTGEVTIQLFTRREAPSLGCDVDKPCSIVVVPNYGRPSGATEDQLDAPWAWERRTVIPLSFLPVEDACPLEGSGLRLVGSPVSAIMLASWRSKTCVLPTDAVRLDYTQLGEPAAREDVAAGTVDVGLTSEPVAAAAAKQRGVVYAPVGLTGLVVAFQIDDASGKPVRELRLNARLIAKIITASYRVGGSANTAGNPVNIFRDKEFLELNPGVEWPSGSPGNRPLLVGDISDTTLALTRWIASDKDAREFIEGKADPWGMKVNKAYQGVELPFDLFPILDPDQANNFQPIQELETVARQLSIAQQPGFLVTVENGVNIVTKPPRQNAGRREIIGIIDAAHAARYQLSTASLRNSAGAWVQANDDSLVAGLRRSVIGPDGVTRTVDQTVKDPAVYPLTMVVTAAISTKAPAADRLEIVKFLDYAAGTGQTPGTTPGDLPAGYTPLTPTLKAELAAARRQVVAGKADTAPTPTPTPTTPTPTPTDAGSGTGGGTVPIAPVAEPTPAPSAPAASPSAPSAVATDPATRTVALAATPASAAPSLPLLLLVVGLGALLLGPVFLLLDRLGRGPSWLRR